MRLLNTYKKSKSSITLNQNNQQDSFMQEFEWRGNESIKIIAIEAVAKNGKCYYSPKINGRLAKLRYKFQHSKVKAKTLKKKTNEWIDH